MLWLAASAGAATIPFLNLRDARDDFYARRPPAYTLLGIGPSYRLGGYVPYLDPRFGTRRWLGAGGNSRFGRRDFLWHPTPIYRGRYLPVGRELYYRLGRTLYHPLDRYREFEADEMFDEWRSPGTLGGTLGNWWYYSSFRRRVVDTSWWMLDYLVRRPLPPPYDPIRLPPLSGVIDEDWGGVISIVPGAELQRDGAGGEAVTLLRELDQQPQYVSRVEQDYGGGAILTMIVPEPATGALLLVGLCVLAARRRLD
jgi:hypothetical protein